MRRDDINVERGVSCLVGIVVAGAAVGLGVLAARAHFGCIGRLEDHATVAVTTTADTDDAPSDAVYVDDARDFRLLLTILTGVALGAATAALPALLGTPRSVYWTTVSWLLWSASVVAVILIYLATLFGSKLLRNEADLLHTAALFAVFLAQCGMFSILIVAKEERLVRDWLMIFAAFASAATITIYMVIRELPSWWRYPDRLESYAIYRRGQLTDMASASATAIFCVVFLMIHIERSRPWGLIACVAALVSMGGACFKQYRERRLLSGLL